MSCVWTLAQTQMGTTHFAKSKSTDDFYSAIKKNRNNKKIN